MKALFFENDDDGFRKWTTSNNKGYYINVDAGINGSYFKMHQVGGCAHLKNKKNLTTTSYRKVCSLDPMALFRWATIHRPAVKDFLLCKTCQNKLGFDVQIPGTFALSQRLQAELARAAEDVQAKAQGFSSSPERNKAVEEYAMREAKAYYEKRGYTVEDTSKDKPYDLRCERHKDRETIFVEVKGTITNGKSVILTRNEVDHAQDKKHLCALFIVCNVEVSTNENSTYAHGGKVRVIFPWMPTATDLSVISYSYRVPA